jgi:phenylacetate 2-hydroxylase
MSNQIPEVQPITAATPLLITLLGGLLTSFSSWMVICAALVILVLNLFDSTDVPFIKDLPFIPGFPIVGNLVQLGDEQPRRLAQLSKKYGPVFQIRLGNKVSPRA